LAIKRVAGNEERSRHSEKGLEIRKRVTNQKKVSYTKEEFAIRKKSRQSEDKRAV
jgi:hypothetical protein